MSFLLPRYLSPLVVDEGKSRVVSCSFMPHAPTDQESAPASLSGLTDEAERARDEVVKTLGKIDAAAARFEEKRAS